MNTTSGAQILARPSRPSPAPGAMPIPVMERARLTITPLRAAVRLAYPVILAALSGALYAAAGPGIGLWPLAFGCWVPFIVAIDGRSGRHALALGLVQGMVTSVIATSWVLPTVRAMTGWGPALAGAGAALIWLYQSGRSALLGWLAARAARRGFPLGLAFGLSLAAAEVVYPMLFGWYSAVQVHDVPLLLQAADIGGPIAVSLGLAGANVMMSGLLRFGSRRSALPGLALAALCPALLAGYGALRLPAVEREMARAPRATIGIVQAYVGRRPSPAVGAERNLALARPLAAREHLDLLVWSENAVRTVYKARELPGALRASLYGSEAGPALPPLLTGVEVEDDDASGKRAPASNSAVLLDPSAGVLGRYDKNHLVPFGEYVPFGDVVPVLYRWFPNSGPLRRGDAPSPLRFGEHLLAPLICYEDILPGYANTMMAGGRPDLLVSLTNDVWFGKTAAVAQHFALSKLRAVEHHRFLVRAGNTGVSALVDPTGRVTRMAPPFVAAAAAGEIAWMRGTTLYETIGDTPWWLCAAAILMMGAVRAPRRFGAGRAPRSSRRGRPPA